jgi:hypothetical protein
MVAPGAEEFLPPPTNGPWLPPERTFATLTSRDRMRAEDVRHAELDFTQQLRGGPNPYAMHVRVFAQETIDQIVTLFGVSGLQAQGHYHVARAGAVDLTGWTVGATGTLGVLTGQIEYSRMSADWRGLGRTRTLRRLAPSVVRDGRESLNDITATVEARFNQARTRMRVVYRSNTAFARDDETAPSAASRFDVQLHQALPYRPLRDSHLELMFAVRTLFRDPRGGASAYDELLTVAPPLRLLGGIQIRF